jgi:hypothetical protein
MRLIAAATALATSLAVSACMPSYLDRPWDQYPEPKRALGPLGEAFEAAPAPNFKRMTRININTTSTVGVGVVGDARFVEALQISDIAPETGYVVAKTLSQNATRSTATGIMGPITFRPEGGGQSSESFALGGMMSLGSKYSFFNSMISGGAIQHGGWYVERIERVDGRLFPLGLGNVLTVDLDAVDHAGKREKGRVKFEVRAKCDGLLPGSNEEIWVVDRSTTNLDVMAYSTGVHLVYPSAKARIWWSPSLAWPLVTKSKHVMVPLAVVTMEGESRPQFVAVAEEQQGPTVEHTLAQLRPSLERGGADFNPAQMMQTMQSLQGGARVSAPGIDVFSAAGRRQAAMDAGSLALKALPGGSPGPCNLDIE